MNGGARGATWKRRVEVNPTPSPGSRLQSQSPTSRVDGAFLQTETKIPLFSFHSFPGNPPARITRTILYITRTSLRKTPTKKKTISVLSRLCWIILGKPPEEPPPISGHEKLIPRSGWVPWDLSPSYRSSCPCSWRCCSWVTGRAWLLPQLHKDLPVMVCISTIWYLRNRVNNIMTDLSSKHIAIAVNLVWILAGHGSLMPSEFAIWLMIKRFWIWLLISCRHGNRPGDRLLPPTRSAGYHISGSLGHGILRRFIFFIHAFPACIVERKTGLHPAIISLCSCTVELM